MYYFNYYKNLAKITIKELIKGESFNARKDSLYLDLGIINPTIGTSNMGDYIINEAIKNELGKLFPTSFFTEFPSQFHTSFDAKRLMKAKDYLFVSGTNLLSSNMDFRYQWKIGPGHKRFLQNKVILMGVGWWQYQQRPNKYTIDLYRTIFNSTHLHSVRDSYSQEMLNSIGINNVINTTCPTLWNITSDFCALIPKTKSTNVVTTLTFYKSNPILDRRILEILTSKYEKVFLWVQGLDDITYLYNIFPGADKITLVPPTLEAYNKILDDPTIEYVGTRLHAGIKAIQKGKRTLILSVDNRAFEIAKDTNLNVIKRENAEQMCDFTDKEYVTDIRIPADSIKKWKENLPKQ